MKRFLFVFLAVILSATPIYGKEAGPAHGKESVTTYRFKHYMHEIFKNYRNTNISIDMRDYDLAEVHTRQFLDNIAKIPEFTKDLAADGIKLDQAGLTAKLEGLKADIAELRKAIKEKDIDKIKKLQPEVLQACIGCHTEAKLKWLFRLPMSANLFADYMHEIQDNIALAEQLAGSNEMDEAEDYVKIANQYLTLLKKVTPYEGPTGVVLDRDHYLGELRSAEGFTLLLLDDFKGKKPIDLTPVKKHLNNVCVACHEPARIK